MFGHFLVRYYKHEIYYIIYYNYEIFEKLCKPGGGNLVVELVSNFLVIFYLKQLKLALQLGCNSDGRQGESKEFCLLHLRSPDPRRCNSL